MHVSFEINIDKLKQGDEETFRRFFTYFYPKLKAFACRFVDENTAEDLVQEVFTSYWEQKKKIEADNIRSFLFKWTQNKCLNHLKHKMVAEEYEAHLHIAQARMAFLDQMTDKNEVFRQIVDRDLRELIEEAVNKLPPKCAQAFRLCYYQEMSHKEIAQEMGISHRTVEGHIRQATRFLREDLSDILTLIFMFYNIF
ncbi:RNA polymerase sigma-70 factor [Parabacteroides sp. PF5-9]|uniref:RNA polymerase sigma-70 factor n=1 Tax=Parabacteroides sp. PF5-9 TaxID=1742404 RepID=UPI0024754337|nr:RNA polymerase sigma-70 factor [Parabacteroides sp. PF5-9]MDH6356210.1 RNA polymerase sigma-70 factor (family 1) [Parabacteroides sp. PF5-9]